MCVCVCVCGVCTCECECVWGGGGGSCREISLCGLPVSEYVKDFVSSTECKHETQERTQKLPLCITDDCGIWRGSSNILRLQQSFFHNYAVLS